MHGSEGVQQGLNKDISKADKKRKITTKKDTTRGARCHQQKDFYLLHDKGDASKTGSAKEGTQEKARDETTTQKAADTPQAKTNPKGRGKKADAKTSNSASKKHAADEILQSNVSKKGKTGSKEEETNSPSMKFVLRDIMDSDEEVENKTEDVEQLRINLDFKKPMPNLNWKKTISDTSFFRQKAKFP